MPADTAPQGPTPGAAAAPTRGRPWRLYGNRRREGRQPPFHRDGTGTRRRPQALAVIGWRITELAGRLSIAPTVIRRLSHHARRGLPPYAGRVAQLYTQLSMTPRPSQHARRRAQAARWPPPLAWDDIDDPAAIPAVPGAGRSRLRAHDIDGVAVLRACEGNPPGR